MPDRMMRRRFEDSPPIASGLAGLTTIVVLFFWWPRGIIGNPVAEFHLFLGIIAAVIVGIEIAVDRRRLVARFRWRNLRRWAGHSDATLIGKILAATAAVTFALIIYEHAQIYKDPWYDRFTGAVRAYFFYLVLATWAYVILVDRIMPDRDDDLAQSGRWLMTLGREGSVQGVRNFALSTLVKVFFLPLMYCYARDDWEFFYSTQLVLDNFTAFYEFAYRFFFFADVLLAIIGYSIATRLLNSHVRWPEQTIGGWVFCIMCYMPFWQIIGRNYLEYNNGIFWGTVLQENSYPYIIWGTLILCLLLVYVLSTAAFGSRFSNLTYRGTVWRGPYALTKHPAYISKNLTMWMISLPFIGHDLGENIGNVLALLGVNAIYLARARYEERCCRQARDYRIYERYMRRHSLLARSLRIFRAGSVNGSTVIQRRAGIVLRSDKD